MLIRITYDDGLVANFIFPTSATVVEIVAEANKIGIVKIIE